MRSRHLVSTGAKFDGVEIPAVVGAGSQMLADAELTAESLQAVLDERHGAILMRKDGAAPSAIVSLADATIDAVERESAKEFRDILHQLVLTRTGDALEVLARLDDPDVTAKRAKTREQELHDAMVDIAVAREAAQRLREMNEEGEK